MKSSLTKRQVEILDFIKKEVRSKGYPPSVREIGVAVGLNSSATVHSHLARLESKGYIRRDPTKPRAIEVLDGAPFGSPLSEIISFPIIGQVTAGAPILAVENIEDYFSLPAHFVPPGEIFMLNIQGDSMIEAGINSGDMVLVRKQNTAQNGDIVVALLEDEATVKTFYKESTRIRLQPENRTMQPIYSSDVAILGKVVALYRIF
ncbi:MAG: transcriptional repressor LexA [bacterium]|nr:transcriptional repressor LexA [bacterium]